MQSSDELPANFDTRFLEVLPFNQPQSSKKLDRFEEENINFHTCKTVYLFLSWRHMKWLLVKWSSGLPRRWCWRPCTTLWRDGPHRTADHTRHAQYPGWIGKGEYLEANCISKILLPCVSRIVALIVKNIDKIIFFHL